MNNQKKSGKSKYTGPVIACAVVLALVVSMLIGFIHLNRMDPAPKGVVWFVIVVLAVVAVGTVAALISRIKEIKGGEENDLGKY